MKLKRTLYRKRKIFHSDRKQICVAWCQAWGIEIDQKEAQRNILGNGDILYLHYSSNDLLFISSEEQSYFRALCIDGICMCKRLSLRKREICQDLLFNG